jgi:hypothetical protein
MPKEKFYSGYIFTFLKICGRISCSTADFMTESLFFVCVCKAELHRIVLTVASGSHYSEKLVAYSCVVSTCTDSGNINMCNKLLKFLSSR